MKDSNGNKPEHYTTTDMIPLLQFNNVPKDLLATLNSLLHYATASANADRDYNLERKTNLYILKIEEGVRIAETINGDDYFDNEIDRIQDEVSKLKNILTTRKDKDNAKIRNKKLWKVIRWSIIILVIFLLLRACKHALAH